MPINNSKTKTASQKNLGENRHPYFHRNTVSLLTLLPEKYWLDKKVFKNVKFRTGFITEEFGTQGKTEVDP